jgi:hypothetical protein
MFKRVFAPSALLIASVSIASAAGGGAGGAAGGGAHASGGHGGSSFGKPAVGNNPFPGVTARPGCLGGGMAGVSSTGAPSPMALPSQTNPSPTNGSAVKGPLQSSTDLSRLNQQDQRLMAEIKRGNDRLGDVGKPNGAPSTNQRAGQAGSVVGAGENLQHRPPLPAQTGTSAATTDRGAAQGKPDVVRMSEQNQRLFREIIRDTEKMGKVGNPAGLGRTQPQGNLLTGPGSDLRRDTTGPHRPTNTMGAASGSAC